MRQAIAYFLRPVILPSVASPELPHFPTLSHIFPHYLTLSHIFPHYLTLSHISDIISHYLTFSHIISHFPTLSHIFPHISHFRTLSHIISHFRTLSQIFPHYLTFSHIISQMAILAKKIYWTSKYVFIFATTFFLEHLPLLRRIQRDMIIHVHTSTCNAPLFLPDLNETRIFSAHFRKILKH